MITPSHIPLKSIHLYLTAFVCSAKPEKALLFSVIPDPVELAFIFCVDAFITVLSGGVKSSDVLPYSVRNTVVKHIHSPVVRSVIKPKMMTISFFVMDVIKVSILIVYNLL